jgi:hypothetical protein
MMVPDEFALYLGDLDVRVVQFASNFRVPLFGEKVEFLGEVDYFGHWDSFLCGGL